MKSGRTVISGTTAGPGIAKGRNTVPIQEFVTHCETAIRELQNGADPELWNY